MVLVTLRNNRMPTVAPRAIQKSLRTTHRLPRALRPLIACRTPYENAATLTTGEPSVAANSAVSAETLVDTWATLLVIVSTLPNCWFVDVTVVVTSVSNGNVPSVRPRTDSRVSSRTLPSLTSGYPTKPTSAAKTTTASSPTMVPAVMICSPSSHQPVPGSDVARRPYRGWGITPDRGH